MANEGRLVIEPAATALVIIDLQKGIVSRPCEPHAASAVVANASRVANALRGRGGFIVRVTVSFSADLGDMLRPASDETVAPGAGGVPADFAEPVAELGAHPRDHAIIKRQWGAFYGTDLDLQLRRRGITTILLCGIATSIGVESTARAAFEHGYQQVFIEDAMSSRSAAEHEHTVTRIFPRLGRVRRTADVLAALA